MNKSVKSKFKLPKNITKKHKGKRDPIAKVVGSNIVVVAEEVDEKNRTIYILRDGNKVWARHAELVNATPIKRNTVALMSKKYRKGIKGIKNRI
jgi:hypothetical protein